MEGKTLERAEFLQAYLAQVHADQICSESESDRTSDGQPTSPHTMTQAKHSLCVFCGSSAGKSDKYAHAATQLAQEMAARSWDLVYGGGTTGLMGVIASACKEQGRHVTGIIPRALTQRERNANIDSEQFGETILVEDMHTRKRMMAERSTAFVSMPGGLGTLEELGIHERAVVLFNVDGFYDGLIAFLDKAVAEGFIGETQRHIIVEAKTAAEVCTAVAEYIPPSGRLNLDWKTVSAVDKAEA